MALPDMRSILIAEDSAAIRSILSFLLRGRGFEVLECGDGNEALERIRLFHPDLAILDVMMPGRLGFDVCRAVKADPDTRDIPVIILTSVTNGAGKSDAHWKDLCGADAFLSKPFKSVELLDHIERLLDPQPEPTREINKTT